MAKIMLWHSKPCMVLVEPVYKPKVKRNCLIELISTGERIVVPRRALRTALLVRGQAKELKPD